MAFDEIQFPLRLRSGSVSGAFFSTEIVTIDGGYEKRNQKWEHPKRCYDARTGIRAASDIMLLAAFFQARAGKARGFRLTDWSDYTSALDGVAVPHAEDQRIGLGDGVTTSFQLVKKYGGIDFFYDRPITKPITGTVQVALDGVQQETGWSFDERTGLVSFSMAPATDAEITAGFCFDVPVRFNTDQISIASLDSNQGETEIPLIEVRA